MLREPTLTMQAIEYDRQNGQSLEAERSTSRIIGFWQEAIRASMICPNCPGIITESEMRDFMEMLAERDAAPHSYCPVCPLCLNAGFIYLEQANDREWIWLEARAFSIYFHGWQHPSFLPKVASLYAKDSRAYRNVLQLKAEGFTGRF